MEPNKKASLRHSLATTKPGQGRTAPPSRAVEVAAALIFRHGQLLITRRHANTHLGGLWEFPGGKREPGETFKQCLKREIREELGVEITVGRLFDSIIHTYPEKTVHLKFFSCRPGRGELQPLGCEDLKWAGRFELKNYEFPAADARLLEKLESSPKLWS
jgi:8-oxo-dGTP diphosphatase